MTRNQKNQQLDSAYAELEELRTKFNELGYKLFRLKDELEDLASDIYAKSSKILAIKEKVWKGKD